MARLKAQIPQILVRSRELAPLPRVIVPSRLLLPVSLWIGSWICVIAMNQIKIYFFFFFLIYFSYLHQANFI